MTKILHLLLASVPFAFAHHTPLKARQISKSLLSDDSEVVAASWYPSWLGTKVPPESLSWDKYTSVTFAFALTTSDPGAVSIDSDGLVLLPKFVAQAKSHNVNALITIGGWTGSQFFSSNVATAANRTIFVKTLTQLVTKYQLDGLDFDWEYPNQSGIGCNVMSPSDSANFLLFLQELRLDPVGSKLIISAAAGITPFTGSDGKPMSDVSAFADSLDWISLMVYDVWGSWSDVVGPNAPLADSCAAANLQQGSAESAVAAWTAAKFPIDKLVLGVAAYGHSFSVSKNIAVVNSQLAPYPTFVKSPQTPGEGETADTKTTDSCGVTSGPTGVFSFEGLVTAGYLTSTGSPAFNMLSRFDNCSQTPYVYNPSTSVEISYDDAKSFAAKGSFIKEKALKGFAMWHAAGDYKDILLDSIIAAIGIVEC